MNINDVLRRRTDLSTFLVHLTKASDTHTAKENLESILRAGKLNAKGEFGLAQGKGFARQKAVCFTETPLEFIHLLAQEISGRAVKLDRYGIAIPKKLGRRLGLNPVWYIDTTPGHDWLSEDVETLVEHSVNSAALPIEEDPADAIRKLTPFFDTMGVGKSFWWEREWRKVGDLKLPNRVLVICPQADIGYFEGLVADDIDFPFCRGSVKFLDPAWSMEEVICRLAGFDPKDFEGV